MQKVTVTQIFTPGRNATHLNFIERPELEARMVRGLTAPGINLVIFGASGSGKSSIVSYILERTYENEVRPVTCNKDSTLSSLIRETLDRIQSSTVSKTTESITRNHTGALWTFLRLSRTGKKERQEEAVTAPELTPGFLAQELGKRGLCWYIEDVHHLRPQERLRLAVAMDAFKNESNNFPSVRVILVGVAATAKELVELNPSMRDRCRMIEIPRMNPGELRKILERGETELNIRFEEDVIKEIVRYSPGNPLVCHTLALEMCLRGGVDERLEQTATLSMKEFLVVQKDAVDSKRPELEPAFERADGPFRVGVPSSSKVVLSFLAWGPQDGLAYKEIISRIRQKSPNYPEQSVKECLDKLCEHPEESVIRYDTETAHWVFRDPWHQSLARLRYPRNTIDLEELNKGFMEYVTPKLPDGITNTQGWSESDIVQELDRVKVEHLGWESTTGSARNWWKAFEDENTHRRALVLRLAEELKNRGATITDFFLAYVYSNTENIQANLNYLDYSTLKKAEEQKKKVNTILTKVEGLREGGKLEEALEELSAIKSMLKAPPDRVAEALNIRASILAKLNRHEEAASDMGFILSMKGLADHWRVTAHSGKAWYLYKTGDLEGLVSESGAALALDPTNEIAGYNHGLGLLLLGRLNEAVDVYNRFASTASDKEVIPLAIEDIEEAIKNRGDITGSNQVLSLLRTSVARLNV